MRLLSTLTETNSSVWIYCETEELQDHFLHQAEKEGYHARSGQKPTELTRQYFYGINDDLNMGFLSTMIWHRSFELEDDTHVKIDYGKFISGEEDYICRTSHIRKAEFGDWNRIAYSTLEQEDFQAQCESFIEGQSLEDYKAYIFRFLIESSWHYTPDQAAQRIEENAEYITECYGEKTPVRDCAVEVGFGCG
jgi:hypothetical protein